MVKLAWTMTIGAWVLPLVLGAAHAPKAGNLAPVDPVCQDNVGDATLSDPSRFGELLMAGRPVLKVVPVNCYSATSRVTEIQRRLARIIVPPGHAQQTMATIRPARDVRVSRLNRRPVVLVNGIVVASVLPHDAKAHGRSAQVIAEIWATNLRMGLATLQAASKGSVPQALQSLVAKVGDVRIAASDPGVLPDSRIAWRIQQRLDVDPQLRAEGLVVTTENDRITIRGQVRDSEQSRRVGQLAQEESFGLPVVREEVRIQGRTERPPR